MNATWWLGLGTLVGLGVLEAGVDSANAKTFAWREEVALHDSGTVIASRRVVLVPGGELGQLIDREGLGCPPCCWTSMLTEASW